MKIVIGTKQYHTVSAHVGKARHWLVYDCEPGYYLPALTWAELVKSRGLHHFNDDAPRPLDGVELVVSGTADDGFIRHTQKRGAQAAER